MYQFTPPPPTDDPKSFQRWAVDQFQKVAQQDVGITLPTLTKAPARLVEGLTVKADGTQWNPGSGAGCYQYRGGSWRFLG